MKFFRKGSNKINFIWFLSFLFFLIGFIGGFMILLHGMENVNCTVNDFSIKNQSMDLMQGNISVHFLEIKYYLEGPGPWHRTDPYNYILQASFLPFDQLIIGKEESCYLNNNGEIILTSNKYLNYFLMFFELVMVH